MGHDPIEEILSGDVLLWRVSWLSYFGHDKVVETKPLDQKLTMDMTIIFWRKKMNVLGRAVAFVRFKQFDTVLSLLDEKANCVKKNFSTRIFSRNAAKIGIYFGPSSIFFFLTQRTSHRQRRFLGV